LLSNAVRFADPMKPKPWVRITSERDGSWARVRVVDNGVGLPEGSHGRVFALFQRLHPTSGDGIGLALVQRYVGLLGGRVSCHPGEGEASTELRVELPADA
ncbi:MAG: ATP-binding protein, partial [Myxococcota bacterium]